MCLNMFIKLPMVTFFREALRLETRYLSIGD